MPEIGIGSVNASLIQSCNTVFLHGAPSVVHGCLHGRNRVLIAADVLPQHRDSWLFKIGVVSPQMGTALLDRSQRRVLEVVSTDTVLFLLLEGEGGYRSVASAVIFASSVCNGLNGIYRLPSLSLDASHLSASFQLLGVVLLDNQDVSSADRVLVRPEVRRAATSGLE